MVLDPAPHPAVPPVQDAPRACLDAELERAALDRSMERMRVVRRELVTAGRVVDGALRDTDRAAVADRKTALQATWREAIDDAIDEDARSAATATWMRQISGLNERSRLALRELASGRRRVLALEAQLRDADLAVAASRIRAEVAEAACADARRQRAAAEEAAVRADGRDRAASVEAAGSDPGVLSDAAAADDDADEIDADEAEIDGPPVAAMAVRAADSVTVRRLLAGDPGTHQAVADELAEMSGQLPARYLLLLDLLVDELGAAALDAGSLAFDRGHALWSQLGDPEARLVVRGLRDLGFRLDIQDGWFGGRAPSSSDLASAVGFAGLDVRGLRSVPAGKALRDLPASVHVAVHEHLRQTAPDLSLQQMSRALGLRAPRLGELWDEWGRVRPLLAAGSTDPGVPVPA